jgi:hypothetical protein
MSDDSIPAPDDQHKPWILISEADRAEILMHLLFPSEAGPLSADTLRRLLPPCDVPLYSDDMLRGMANGVGTASVAAPAKPKTELDDRSPIDHTLHSIQTFGFTHPSHGPFLMVPKEFRAILARETQAVATIIWEIMQRTIGWDSGREPGGRREWARLSVRDFERDKILRHTKAQRGITRALKKGYIERRRSGKG